MYIHTPKSCQAVIFLRIPGCQDAPLRIPKGILKEACTYIHLSGRGPPPPWTERDARDSSVISKLCIIPFLFSGSRFIVRARPRVNFLNREAASTRIRLGAGVSFSHTDRLLSLF